MVFRRAEIQNNIIGANQMKQFRYGFMAMILAMPAAHADMYSALQIVYENNPVISAGRKSVGAAEMDVRLAKSEAHPYIGAAANADIARTKIMGETFDYKPTQIGIEARQNIFQGFSTIAQIKAAKGLLAAARADLYATQQNVFLDAINAYIGVLQADDVLNLNKNNRRVLQEYYDYCADMAGVGRLTKTDVAQAAARLEMAKYALADAQAKYDNSLESFRRVFGKTLSEYTDVDLKRMAHLFPESISEAETEALKSHPALIALDARENAARENITVAQKTMMPSVDVRASAMQADDLPYIDRVRDNRVGVYLKLPLYDRGTAFATTDKARYTVGEIEDQIVNARRVVIENLRRAWNTYEAQGYAIRAAESGIAANKMALDGTRAEQKSGRRTVLDVLNAEQELLNTQVSLSNAKHAQVAAFFAVLSAAGKLNAQNLGIVTTDDSE